HVGDVPHAVVTGVTATRAVADPDLGKIVGAFDDALAEQEAGRQVDVVARSAHGQCDRLAVDPDAERLFSREQVRALGYGLARGARFGQPDPPHQPTRRPATHPDPPAVAAVEATCFDKCCAAST